MGQKQMLLRTGFTKGVKPSLDPSIVPPDALWKGQNLRPNKAGVLRIRTGCRSIDDTTIPFPIRGMVATSEHLYVLTMGLRRFDGRYNKVESYGGSGADLDAREIELLLWTYGGEPTIFILGHNKIIKFTIGQDDMMHYILPYEPQENEKPNVYDVAAKKCTTGLIRPTLSQRMILTGNPEAPNEVYFSAPLDPTYFPSDQVLKLPDDGGKIVGLAVWYNALLIFRDKDIYAFFGTDMNDPEAQLVLQNDAVGCLARKSIQRIPEYGIIFLGNDNVYLLSGVTGLENQLTLKPIGDDISEPLQRAIKSGGVEGICSTYFDNTYILTVPQSRTSTFKWRDGAWYIDTGPYVSSYAKFKGKLYGGSFFNGNVFEFNEADLTDADDNYSMYVTTRRHLFTPTSARITKLYLYVLAGYIKKDVEEYYFGDLLNTLMYNEGVYKTTYIRKGSEQHLKVSLLVDGKKYTVDKFDVFVKPVETETTEVDMPLQIYEARFNPVIKGHTAQLKIETVTPGEDIAILGYGLEYFTRKSLDDKSKSRKAISFIGGSNVK